MGPPQIAKKQNASSETVVSTRARGSLASPLRSSPCCSVPSSSLSITMNCDASLGVLKLTVDKETRQEPDAYIHMQRERERRSGNQ